MKALVCVVVLAAATYQPAPSIGPTPPRLAKVVCLYRATIRPDSLSPASREELTQLAIADSASEFRSVNIYKIDSLKARYEGAGVSTASVGMALGQVMAIPRYKFDGVVIKTRRATRCRYYGKISRVAYVYDDPDYPCRWTLTPDTLTVAGYKCQRATTRLAGRAYLAWFTRQLPFSDGPYKFAGLPGLIVSLHDATNSYKFDLVHLTVPAKPYAVRLPDEVTVPKTAPVTVTKSQFYDAYFLAERNFSDYAVAAIGGHVENEEQLRKNCQERLKHRNNPIELGYKKY